MGMTSVYRVMWIPAEGSKHWRYVTGDIYFHFMGSAGHAVSVPSEVAGKSPMIFENPDRADRLARAMTDSHEVFRVAVRKEDTMTLYPGIGVRKDDQTS